MSLHYPSLDEILANEKWMVALQSDTFGIANPSGRTICNRIELTQFMIAMRTWSSPSPTARKILEFVGGSYVKIHVIGMKGCGYSCFDSDCPVPGEGTAYVDIVRQYKVNAVNLHTNIVVLHELGHAKQFIENPSWFSRVARSESNVNLKDIQTAAIGMEAGTYTPHRFAQDAKGAWKGVQKLPQKTLRGQQGMGPDWKPIPVPPPPPPIINRAGSIAASALQNAAPGGPPPAPGAPPPPPGLGFPPPPPGAPGGPGAMDKRQKLQLAKGKLMLDDFVDPHKKWAVVVEQDNMARHEWQICADLRQPVRPGYNHITIG